MAQASWMVDRLDEQTRIHHADADSDFDILFFDRTTPDEYFVYLMRVYGFELPLEAALARTPNLDLMIDLSERQKGGLLTQDLLALGLRHDQLADVPQCLRIPQFRGAAEALGWMYVVERCTLAHSVVRRHLLTRLPREMRNASQYLQAYAGVAGTRWRMFGNVLDDVARQPAIADRIVDAANEAFRAQRRWVAQDQRIARVARVASG